tara:strand:- start:788 stop:1003 length:216 start_codon:yes stop_codon:yes gene_type:complete
MGGSPSIPTPPPLPPAPKVEDPAIDESREKYKIAMAERTTRKGTILTKQTREGQLMGEEASITRTKLGGGL